MQQVLINSDVDCIKLSGDLSASNAENLQNELRRVLLQRRCPFLVADMTDVESLDSAGLMALVATLNLAQEHGKSFVLAGISPSIQIIFELTKLDQAFEVRDDLLLANSTNLIALAA